MPCPGREGRAGVRPTVSDEHLEARIERLVRAARSGEDREAACAALYGIYAPRVRGFFARAGAGEEARDLTQDTMFRVFRNIAKFRGDADFSSWVFTIARRRWASHWRERRAAKRRGIEVSLSEPVGTGDEERSDVEEVLVSEDPGPERRAEDRQRLRRVAGGAAQLPPQMRRCFQLRMGQDLGVPEIARLLGLSDQTVKSHLYQARRRLGPLLDDPSDPAAGPVSDPPDGRAG